MSENHSFNLFLLLLVVSIKLGRNLNVIEMICIMMVYLFFVWINQILFEKINEGKGDRNEWEYENNVEWKGYN